MKTLGVTLAILTLGLSGWIVETICNAGWTATLIVIAVCAAACTAVIHTHRADQADQRARQDRRYASQHPAVRGPR
jgi:hypothetical protein